jgi:mannose-1-phosphate guanylyltransferase
MVLLGGSVRAGAFGSAIGRLVFQLPLDSKSTILDSWAQAAADLAPLAEQVIPLRVMIDKAAPQPLPITSGKGIEIERDPFDFRGTGGVLRDLALHYEADDYLLVANAAQILCEPLSEIVSVLATMGGDVSIVSHLDGTPSGLMLVRCGALAGIPEQGFVDMKEQALPAIAKDHRVTVLHRQHPTALPVRTLADYIQALRHNHRRRAGISAPASAFSENWESTFFIIEEGASVDPTAKLHDSIVLRDGRAEARSVAVQSVICPGGILGRNEVKIDSLVHPQEREARNGK